MKTFKKDQTIFMYELDENFKPNIYKFTVKSFDGYIKLNEHQDRFRTIIGDDVYKTYLELNNAIDKELKNLLNTYTSAMEANRSSIELVAASMKELENL